MTLCVTIATNITNGLLINYTRIGSAFNKLSEYFYILTLTIMAVVFDFLPAIAEYWLRIKNGISRGTFCFQIGEYERVKANIQRYIPITEGWHRLQRVWIQTIRGSLRLMHETAWRSLCLFTMARDGQLIQRKQFLSSSRHNLPLKLSHVTTKLYGNICMWMQQ